MSISRDVFLSSKFETKDVKLPGLDGTITARELASDEVAEFTRRRSESEPKAVAYLLCIGVVDDAGKPLFTDADAEALAKRPFKHTDPIIDAILSLSGLREEKK